MEISLIVNYVVSLFMLCSPLTAIPAFLGLTIGKSKNYRNKLALILGFAVSAVLIISTWTGSMILNGIGIRISAFQCAGGIIVFLLALSMLNAEVSPIRQTEAEEKIKTAIPIVPLAIPLMAGPGSISGAIVAANLNSTLSSLVILTIADLCVGALCALTLYFATNLERRLGSSGVNIVTRIGGLILAALAFEIFAQGVEGMFFK